MFLKFDVPLAITYTLLNALENILIEKDSIGGNISVSVHISVTRQYILTHNTSNESWDHRLFNDTKDMPKHTRMIEKSR